MAEQLAVSLSKYISCSLPAGVAPVHVKTECNYALVMSLRKIFPLSWLRKELALMHRQWLWLSVFITISVLTTCRQVPLPDFTLKCLATYSGRMGVEYIFWHLCLLYLLASGELPNFSAYYVQDGRPWFTALSCDRSHCVHQPAGDAVIHNMVSLPPSFQKPSLLNWNKALLSSRIRNLKSHVFHCPIWQTQTE